MAAAALADTGFLVALLRRRDRHHSWAEAQVSEFPPPWHTCEAVLSEAFHMLAGYGVPELGELINLGMLEISFALAEQRKSVVQLMRKYEQVPMSLADACLVRMTEQLADPVLLTINSDFRVYRRHGRQMIPCATP